MSGCSNCRVGNPNDSDGFTRGAFGAHAYGDATGIRADRGHWSTSADRDPAPSIPPSCRRLNNDVLRLNFELSDELYCGIWDDVW